MTNTEKMVDRVKKLLALAGNNPSEEEARTALMKANELIAKHNLNLSEETGERVEYAVLPATHSNNEGYRTHLASVIAPSFRCKVILMGNTVHFFGRKQDAESCVAVFNYVYRVSHNIGLRLERKARKEGRNTHGVANSYWIGFIAGIKQELDAQCKALMVVVPDDVHQQYDSRYAGCGQYRGGMRQTGCNYSAYGQGLQDGQHSMRNRRGIEG